MKRLSLFVVILILFNGCSKYENDQVYDDAILSMENDLAMAGFYQNSLVMCHDQTSTCFDGRKRYDQMFHHYDSLFEHHHSLINDGIHPCDSAIRPCGMDSLQHQGNMMNDNHYQGMGNGGMHNGGMHGMNQQQHSHHDHYVDQMCSLRLNHRNYCLE